MPGLWTDRQLDWLQAGHAIGSVSSFCKFTILFEILRHIIIIIHLLFGHYFPQFSWIFIIFGHHSWQICVSRFLCGVTGGAAFTCFPQFVAEIATDRYNHKTIRSLKKKLQIILQLLVVSEDSSIRISRSPATPESC